MKRPFEALGEEGGDEGHQYRRFQARNKPQNKPFRVKPATRKEDEPAFRIFVRNCPFRATAADIAMFFSEVREVSWVRLGANKEGRPKGWLVQLDSEKAVEAAMALSGQKLMDRELQVLPNVDEGGTQAGCCFCFSNPKVDPKADSKADPTADSSLVVAVGKHVYMGLQKGAVVKHHVQLVPIDHLPNTLLLSAPAALEYTSYVDALRTCFKQKLNEELILFERFMGMRGHCVVGALPISAQAAERAQSVFEDMCQKAGFECEVLPPEMQRHELHEKLGYRKYLTLTLPDNTVLLHLIGKEHPINFAREVVANIVGRPDKADCKNCAVSKEEDAVSKEEEAVSKEEEEARAVEQFARMFSEYQPQ